MIDKDLLQIIACPVCTGNLKDENDFLLCTDCRRRYPVKEGIPVLLEEEALLSDEEGL